MPPIGAARVRGGESSDTDIAFIEDIEQRQDSEHVFAALKKVWSNSVPKRDAMGIHGIVFYQLYGKHRSYPTLRNEEAVNPDGSVLRLKRTRSRPVWPYRGPDSQ